LFYYEKDEVLNLLKILFKINLNFSPQIKFSKYKIHSSLTVLGGDIIPSPNVKTMFHRLRINENDA